MAQLPGGSFDANQQPEWSGSGAAPVIPEGPKMIRIVESGMKPTKAGTGEYLELVMEVLTPEFSGHKHTQRLNLNNPNPQAVEIANQELGAICRAVGKPVIQDSVELHGIPFVAEFAVDPPTPAIEATADTPAKRARPAQNRIVAYETAGGPAAAGGGAARPSNPEAASQAASGSGPAPGPQEQPPATQQAAQAQQPAQADADEEPPWA